MDTVTGQSRVALDLDTHIRQRVRVIETCTAWNELPASPARTNAYVDACVDYAGHAHVAFSAFLAGIRRNGGDVADAVAQWENDW